MVATHADGQHIEVTEIVLRDDLAVLKLKHALYISQHVQPICLASSGLKRSTSTPSKCFYSDWGNSSETKWSTSLTVEEANSDFGGLHICLENNVPVLTGIASIVQNEYGRRSTSYANVLQNRNWIESQMVITIIKYDQISSKQFYFSLSVT